MNLSGKRLIYISNIYVEPQVESRSVTELIGWTMKEKVRTLLVD